MTGNIILLYVVSFIITICINVIALFINPIYSALCLLLIVLTVAVALISLNVFYLALTLIIIYGGAIIILFLFIIIITNPNLKISFDYKLYFPNSLILFFFMFTNLLFFKLLNSSTINLDKNLFVNDVIEIFIYSFNYESNDIIIFSNNLFSEYFIFLFLIILIMLFTLIAAIAIAKKSEINPFSNISDNEDKAIDLSFKIKNFYDNTK